MAITVADNFSYQGKKPLDGRDTFATLAAMKAYAEASVYDGCLSYCDEDGKRYEFKSTNTVDPTTGKWRELATGGGGETYSDFTGATASTAGAHGLVPAPSAGDEGKVLFGNGAWGALPSVDLSVLSNEAFIFSETEKVVGQWTDKKLLWAKTIILDGTYAGDMDIGNIGSEKVVHFLEGGAKQSQGQFITIPNINVSWNASNFGLFIDSTGVIKLRAGSETCSHLEITIFYTKTTDSPLPSDVKFAGVTSSGEVIYKKHITGLNVSIDTSTWNTVCNIPNVSVVIDAIAYYNNEGTGLKNTLVFKEIEPYANGDIKVKAANSRTINEATVRYTISS